MQTETRTTPEYVEKDWPQGFDIRAEHAEQQELLQPPQTDAGRALQAPARNN